MANNYCETSSFLKIPKDKFNKADAIVYRVTEEIEKTDECGCCEVDVEVRPDGVWFHNEESFNPEHVEEIARALIEELELDEPFYCSWAFTCSKPRIDEFGGGAFAIKRGYETYWVDAMSHVMQQVQNGGLVRLEKEE